MKELTNNLKNHLEMQTSIDYLESFAEAVSRNKYMELEEISTYQAIVERRINLLRRLNEYRENEFRK